MHMLFINHTHSMAEENRTHDDEDVEHQEERWPGSFAFSAEAFVSGIRDYKVNCMNLIECHYFYPHPRRINKIISHVIRKERN